MSRYRWRERPDIVAKLVDSASIKSWSSMDLVLKPNESVTIVSNGKIQDTLSETNLRNYAGGWPKWIASKIGLGASDHKMLFALNGPMDLLFLVDGQLSCGTKVKGMVDLRVKISRDDSPRLLNVFASGPRVIDRAYLVQMYSRELSERVVAPLLSGYDANSIRSAGFLEDFEMRARSEMRSSLSLAGLSLMRAFITMNETDVDRLNAYRHMVETQDEVKQVDTDSELAGIERAREITLARIEMENDATKAKARGETEAAMEAEVLELRKKEAEWEAIRHHEDESSKIRLSEKEAKLNMAMDAFQTVQAAKEKRLRLEAELVRERQAQSDTLQKEIMEMAAGNQALTPEVMVEFLRQQTNQKEADK